MDQEQMQAWMKYASPSEHHEFLNKLAGKWHATVEDESKAKLGTWGIERVRPAASSFSL